MAHFKYRFFTKSRKENNSYYFSEIPTDTEYNKETGIRDGEFVSPKKFECNLYQGKVSAGLVETNTILLLADDGTADSKNVGTINSLSNDVSIYKDAVDSDWKLFLFIDTSEQEDLRFYTVDHESNEVVWTDRLVIDPSTDNVSFNIGFIGDKDGQYENKVYLFEIQSKKSDPSEFTGFEPIEHVGTITVHSSAVGEDERYRTLFANFGIPDPISYMDVFNDETEEEYNTEKYDDKINYETLNRRSKQLFLSYDQIFPYVGTYKALINAVDFLGYDDIYFKEWYYELSDNKGTKSKLVSYNIDYKNGNTSFLSSLPINRRLKLKKTNWLSMIYKISEEVLDDEGSQEFEVLPDNVCFPLSKTNYDLYQSDEILLKLISLKQWLEKNIIGIHCRIIDIGGEGIVFERYKDKIYGKIGQGMESYYQASITPYLYKYSGNIQLDKNGADIRIGVKELEQDETFTDQIKELTARVFMSSNTAVLKAQDSSLEDFAIVDMPIIISDGEIFFDPLALSSANKDMTSNFIQLPAISIESARLRDPNVAWDKSICYEISNSYNGDYEIIEYNDGERGDTIASKNEYIYLRPSRNGDASLRYSTDNTFNVPLFMMTNFYDYSLGNIFEDGKEYVLEILDGKMTFYGEFTDKYGELVSRTMYINFHFDTDANEQSIEVNYEYSKNAYTQDLIDPDTGEAKLITINVKNTGSYIPYVFGIDECGTIYGGRCAKNADVTLPNPSIVLYSTTKETNNSEDFYNTNQCAEEPVPYNPDWYSTDTRTVTTIDGINVKEEYEAGAEIPVSRKNYLISDVSVSSEASGSIVVKYATYPTISYAVDTPKSGDIAHFLNISDQIKLDHTETVDGEDRIYVKRCGEKAANVLDTGVMKDGSSTTLVQKANFIIYDNLHNVPYYQETVLVKYDPSQKLFYLCADDSSEEEKSRHLWYNTEGSEYKEVKYEVNAGDSSLLDYVAIDQNAPQKTDTSKIATLMAMTGSYTTYIQAVYELKFTYVSCSSDGISMLELQTGQGEIPNADGVNVFDIGQVIELKQKYSLWSNVLTKVSSARVVNVQKTSNGGKIKSFKISVDCPFLLFPESSSSSELSKTVYVSHAHKAFVDYTFDVESAQELRTGRTKLYVKDDTNLNFVDDTFSIYSVEYDINNAKSLWTESGTVGKNTVPSWATGSNPIIYKHDIPFTITTTDSIVVRGKQANQDATAMHYQWKVYIYDTQKDENILMLESWNTSLFLTPTITGIYSISLRMYDDYGNDSYVMREGAFKVI